MVVAYLSSRVEYEKRRYHAIFSTSGSGIVVINRDDHSIREANRTFLEITEDSAPQGKNIGTFFAKSDMATLEEMLQKTEIVTGLEMELKLWSGEVRTCLISGSILSQHEIVISAVDITVRKKALKATEEANRKLNILSSITRHDTSNKLLILSGHLTLHADTLRMQRKRKGSK